MEPGRPSCWNGAFAQVDLDHALGLAALEVRRCTVAMPRSF